MNHTRRVELFIGGMVLAAVAATSYAGIENHTPQPAYALAVLALAAATSRMKVKLPGIDGNMSVNLPFLLTAVVSLSAAEAIAIAGASTVVQCWPRQPGKLKAQQVLFNVSMMAFSVFLANVVLRASWLRTAGNRPGTAGLILATATLFVGQTVPVAAIVALSERLAAPQTWWNIAQMSFPYYVVSAGVTSMMQTVSHHMGWQTALAVFPVMYGIHLSYRLYFGRMAEASPALEPAVALTRAARAGA